MRFSSATLFADRRTRPVGLVEGAACRGDRPLDVGVVGDVDLLDNAGVGRVDDVLRRAGLGRRPLAVDEEGRHGSLEKSPVGGGSTPSTFRVNDWSHGDAASGWTPQAPEPGCPIAWAHARPPRVRGRRPGTPRGPTVGGRSIAGTPRPPSDDVWFATRTTSVRRCRPARWTASDVPGPRRGTRAGPRVALAARMPARDTSRLPPRPIRPSILGRPGGTSAHELASRPRPSRGHRRRHRRQQHGLASRPTRLARHRPPREGHAAEPGRFNGPREQLHLLDRPLEGDDGVHARQRSPVPRARGIRRDRRHRGRPDARADGGVQAPHRLLEVVGHRGLPAPTPRGQGDGPVHRGVGDPRRLLHAGRRDRRLPPGRDADAAEGR